MIRILHALIRLYQVAISPFFGPKCRFYPSCSTYALQATKKHGIVAGLALAVKRILRCHPWGASGFDPVPEGKFKRK